MNKYKSKDMNSNRTKKCLQRNSLNNPMRVDYIFGLCEAVFDFDKYKIMRYYDIEEAFFITYGTRSYIAYVNNDTACINVLEKYKDRDEYFDTEMIFGSDQPWFDFLLWVKNRI